MSINKYYYDKGDANNADNNNNNNGNGNVNGSDSSDSDNDDNSADAPFIHSVNTLFTYIWW